jgi:hypothetical protein
VRDIISFWKNHEMMLKYGRQLGMGLSSFWIYWNGGGTGLEALELK